MPALWPQPPASLASAYQAGFEIGLRDGYEVIVEMDADLSHDPFELPRVIEGSAVDVDPPPR